MPHDLQDRFRGSVIGQCLGDALGFPVEGFPPEVCGPYAERYVSGWDQPPPGRTPFAFGQYTDDSQLARELLCSLVDHSAWRPEAYAARIGAIVADGRLVGRGRATEEAALRLIAGVPWDQAGTPPPAAGNGSAMRAGPIGLWCHRRVDRLVALATDQGRITHQDPRASAGAVAIAAAVRLALTTAVIEPAPFVRGVADLAAQIDGTMATAIQQLPAWLPLAPEEAVGHIARLGMAADHQDGWQGISPFVVPSVVWSLYSFLRTPTDYIATIRTAIAVGGDVDTTAAMAGAISGAHVGLSSLPDDLTARLNDQGTWRRVDLVTLADAAFRQAPGDA